MGAWWQWLGRHLWQVVCCDHAVDQSVCRHTSAQLLTSRCSHCDPWFTARLEGLLPVIRLGRVQGILFAGISDYHRSLALRRVSPGSRQQTPTDVAVVPFASMCRSDRRRNAVVLSAEVDASTWPAVCYMPLLPALLCSTSQQTHHSLGTGVLQLQSCQEAPQHAREAPKLLMAHLCMLRRCGACSSGPVHIA